MNEELVPHEAIEQKIYLIRGQKVMLDRDLAKLYGVRTFVLNQAVKRNIERFPEDFMFSLTREEIMRVSQIVISSEKPDITIKFANNINAFTEYGILMLSSALNSPRAIQMNIQIMRVFVRLRQILATHKELALKLEQLEVKVGVLDSEVKAIFDAIKQLMSLPPDKPKKIGFLKE
jgi:hypothetical protein